jgi:para-nitrobenzyl esterase
MASIRDGLYGWAAQNLVRQQAAIGQPSLSLLFPAQHAGPEGPRSGGLPRQRDPYVFGQVGEGAALGPNWPKPPLSAEEAGCRTPC